ncbi:MAG: prepilin-type N-terminal cleavage/methylation domain-containing protein [Candidatus Amesbacteria bacterium]|nr:prepilin-type N-terminal cleavage/methylation domain-containing protein [Candidatus Amesbacteria bacterium]
MKQGFTLIEMLVSIGIVMIIFSAGIASYKNATRNQALDSDVSLIIQTLNIAKTNVNSGKKVNCASSLEAWQVSFLQKSFVLQELCGSAFTTNTYNLASNNIITANPAIIKFYALGQGATAGTITVGTKTITVSSLGLIQ